MLSVLIAIVIIAMMALAVATIYGHATRSHKLNASGESYRDVETALQLAMTGLVRTAAAGGCKKMSIPAQSLGLAGLSITPFAAIPGPLSTEETMATGRCGNGRSPPGSPDYHFCFLISGTSPSRGSTESFDGAQHPFVEADAFFVNVSNGANSSCAAFAAEPNGIKDGNTVALLYYSVYWGAVDPNGPIHKRRSGAFYAPPY